MTSKIIKNHLRNLRIDAKNYTKTLNEETQKLNKTKQKKVNEVIRLFEERKITQNTTAQKLIKGLLSPKPAEYQKALTQYNENIDTWRENEPLNKRMAGAKEENKRKQKENQKEKQYLIDFLLYVTLDKEKTEKSKIAFYDDYDRAFGWINYDVRQASIKPPAVLPLNIPDEVIGNYVIVEPSKDLERVERKFRKSKKGKNYYDSHLLDHILGMLGLDKKVQEFYGSRPKEYISAVKILGIEEIEDGDGKREQKKEKLKNAENVSMYHEYIETAFKPNASTIKEAIARNDYIETECWVNALVEHYKDCPRKKNQLTREKILDVLKMNEEEFNKNGASIEDMEVVFNHFTIPVRIFDIIGNCIYKTEHVNKKIRAFYGLVKNNHIYVMNFNLSSLQQHKGRDYMNLKVRAPIDFHLNKSEEPSEYIIFDKIDDILKLHQPTEEEIKGKKPQKEKEYKLIHSKNDLIGVLCDIVESGYEPKIRYEAGTISQIKLRFMKNTYIIATQNLVPSSIDGSVRVKCETTFNNMNKAMFKFNKALFNPLHKSFYTDTDINVLDEYRTIVPSGKLQDTYRHIEYREKFNQMTGKVENQEYHHFIEASHKNACEIDMTKAFTHALTKMKKIPVFNQFDKWVKYNGEEIEDLVLYTVEVYKANLFFNKRFCLCYGKFLKDVLNDGIIIKYYKKPSFIYNCDYKKIVKELVETHISDDTQEDTKLKKEIANVNIGLLEKGVTTAQKSVLFKDLREAQLYQHMYGGRINIIKQFEKEEGYDDDDDDYDEFSDSDDEEEKEEAPDEDTKNKGKYYVLNVEDRAVLKNGYRYIKELLLQYHNYRIYKDYNTLRENDIDVFSVKTDAFTILRKDLQKAMKLLKFGKDIGDWKGVLNNFGFPHQQYEMKQNESINIPEVVNERIMLKDEWDSKEAVEKVLEHKHVLIKALFAGSGKSHIPKQIQDKNILFVTPTNNLNQECGVEAVTINTFFSIQVGEEKLKDFDHSFYDVIVFDEIYFNSIPVLARIKTFVEKNPDKIIVATGDEHQLQGVVDITNTQDYRTYLDSCIKQIFKHYIYLEECKRLTKEEDRIKLKNIYHDIFKTDMTIKQIIEKYFKYTEEIELIDNNVAYTNETCRKVSQHIRKERGIEEEYVVGDEVICRVYTRYWISKFNVNLKFKITEIKKNMVTLLNEATRILQEISLKKLRQNFIYASCYTCHSKQGCSIDGDVIIYDWMYNYVSKEWLYTAITRAKDLNKIRFYKHEITRDIKPSEIERYFNQKVKQYKSQDIEAGRPINEEDYVNVEWLMGQLKNRCTDCNEPFVVERVDQKLTTNLTANRLDNERAHYISNCNSKCILCNCCAR